MVRVLVRRVDASVAGTKRELNPKCYKEENQTSSSTEWMGKTYRLLKKIRWEKSFRIKISVYDFEAKDINEILITE